MSTPLFSFGSEQGRSDNALPEAPPTRNARVTDAVIAAVKVMSKLKNKTSIMVTETGAESVYRVGVDGLSPSEPNVGGFGNPVRVPIMAEGQTISDIDRLVRDTNQVILRFKDRMSSVRLVRWGIFADEWIRFQDEIELANRLQAPPEQKTEMLRMHSHRLSSYRKRALSWANETAAFLRGMGTALGPRGGNITDEGASSYASSPTSSHVSNQDSIDHSYRGLTMRKFAWVIGIAIAAVVGGKIWMSRKNQGTTIAPAADTSA